MAKLDMKNLPVFAKAIISVLPGLLLTILTIVLIISPKQKEIKVLEAKIDEQNNKIAASMTKAAKLDVLIKENEKLLGRLNELKEQLPEGNEIFSSLLKQISDLAVLSGLEFNKWKSDPKTTHSSGIVFQIPVTVDVNGTFHQLGYFLSSLTRLNRIVNINKFTLTPQKVKGNNNLLTISLTALTFTAVPEAEIAKTEAEVKTAAGTKAKAGK